MTTLDGKVALVTGGAGGIGSGICEVLAAQGATVIVGYNRSRSEAAALIERLPNHDARHAALAVPVTDSAALAALARQIGEKYGRLDILVNCHGATRFVPATDLDALDDELIDRVLATNVRGTFATVRALKDLLARDGSGLVVNISSIAAKLAIGSNIMYCASKAAVDTLTKSLALALAPKVRVVSVSPGLVVTEAAKKFEQSFLDGHIARTPLKRLTTPEDIGQAVVALAAHMTAVTGVIIPVDAGRSLS
ncbi:MAG TPA: SDR family oxidoreductase [Burkholderiaceae bacterium]|nr:SDR family oxidoreductase [Burkholderiaceae bacterium]